MSVKSLKNAAVKRENSILNDEDARASSIRTKKLALYPFVDMRQMG